MEECPSVGAASRAADNTATTPAVVTTPTPAPETAHTATDEPKSPSAPRGPDAKFNELLAQAREIMKDPEFMDEVMALAKLKARLQEELNFFGRGANTIGHVLNHMIWRTGR
jgi:hypothetical protein